MCCHSEPCCRDPRCWLGARGPSAELQDRGSGWASDLPDLKLKPKNVCPIPVGSISIPNKNGHLISTTAAQEKVISAARKGGVPVCLCSARCSGDRAGDTCLWRMPGSSSSGPRKPRASERGGSSKTLRWPEPQCRVFPGSPSPTRSQTWVFTVQVPAAGRRRAVHTSPLLEGVHGNGTSVPPTQGAESRLLPEPPGKNSA